MQVVLNEYQITNFSSIVEKFKRIHNSNVHSTSRRLLDRDDIHELQDRLSGFQEREYQQVYSGRVY